MEELLAIGAKHSIPVEHGEMFLPKAENPVIVVEGLDATGT